MKRHSKAIILSFFISQIIVFVISFLRHGHVTLINYINISFYIAFILLVLSLIILTINSGVFDLAAQSFRKTTKILGRYMNKGEMEEMRPLSQLITVPLSPLLITGLLNGAFMVVALIVYYM